MQGKKSSFVEVAVGVFLTFSILTGIGLYFVDHGGKSPGHDQMAALYNSLTKN